MASLRAVADAIQVQVTEDMDPEPAPKFHFGISALYKEDRPPRIVFVPRTERIIPAGQGADGVSDPRPLWIRRATVEAHIWGKDSAETERFLDILVQAIHALAWGSYDLSGGGSWIAAGEARSDKGEIYVLSMLWDVPITRAPDTFAVVTAMPLDPLTVET